MFIVYTVHAQKKISKERFSEMYEDLKANGFWCLNTEDLDEVYTYLEENLAIRFARLNQAIPNFEIKYPKNRIDNETFVDYITVVLPNFKLKISSLERQIAFKRFYLKSQKDIEDALHIEELFKEKLDKDKINKFKDIVENYE